ncbi:MAG TPA: DUF4350 domain-containing protein [Caldimonas sp.]|nr:DUF4350 domain-containing protein [Caldimonas sp.]
MQWLVGALAIALAVALAALIGRSIEWVDTTTAVPPSGEAARDPFYAAKQLARKLGASVTTVRNFEQLPPPGATLVIASPRWAMFPGRAEALQRWVSGGGRLVVLQSAWSATGEAPSWVPIRSSRPPHRVDPDVAAAAAAAAAGSDPVRAIAEITAAISCRRYAEPDGSVGAFGPLRAFLVCARPSHILHARAPRWQIADDDGAVAMRVTVGRGDVTSTALEGAFANDALLRRDGALAFAAMLQLAAGDRVWFLVDETRAPLLALLWQHGAPALVLALAALALALWRNGTRFGPRLLDPPLARRSIGEQVRRTAAFVARGGGAALHGASIRALEDEARRSIANYAGLLARRDRSDAIARKTGTDAVALAAAMSPMAQPDRRSIAAAIHRLENARRALAVGARRPLQRPASADASPP